MSQQKQCRFGSIIHHRISHSDSPLRLNIYIEHQHVILTHLIQYVPAITRILLRNCKCLLFVGCVGWGHIRSRRAYVKQGRSIDELPYKAFGYPYTPLFTSTLCVLIILGQGYTCLVPQFQVEKFFNNYIVLFPLCLCYIIYKIARRSKAVLLEECDFDTGRATRLEIKLDDE